MKTLFSTLGLTAILALGATSATATDAQVIQRQYLASTCAALPAQCSEALAQALTHLASAGLSPADHDAAVAQMVAEVATFLPFGPLRTSDSFSDDDGRDLSDTSSLILASETPEDLGLLTAASHKSSSNGKNGSDKRNGWNNGKGKGANKPKPGRPHDSSPH
ncbi:hypothetical protein AQS8620_02981 [Aquimixticola soesokkakensis]|uniref:Uncharacterized protein n=1 Tax=Aquimixticola soesokkakensis TaxID=1519096 RepID=A0A1Y5TLG3_9RHOB|nr:hypothetical protein [Aquimixticola soesokkakensis]SLN64881.1 hypothetical protein AQS8620_02981 [Aquimixticola soesokkakensis]